MWYISASGVIARCTQTSKLNNCKRAHQYGECTCGTVLFSAAKSAAQSAAHGPRKEAPGIIPNSRLKLFQCPAALEGWWYLLCSSWLCCHTRPCSPSVYQVQALYYSTCMPCCRDLCLMASGTFPFPFVIRRAGRLQGSANLLSTLAVLIFSWSIFAYKMDYRRYGGFGGIQSPKRAWPIT